MGEPTMQMLFCGACGALPSAFSGNTCFLLRSDGGTVLIDASGDPVVHLLRAGVSLSDLDAIILTHRHTDHVGALPGMFQILRIIDREKPLPIYANGLTTTYCQGFLRAFNHLDRDDLPQIDWLSIEDGTRLEIAGIDFEFFPSDHSVPCHGFVARQGSKTLVYGADGRPNPLFSSLDLSAPTLIHEATGLHRDVGALNNGGHSSARQAGEAARAVGAARLFVCGLRVATQEDVAAVCAEAADAAGIPAIFPEVDRPYEI
jgi:ribonuclease BN (tRNA processing enzyme)